MFFAFLKKGVLLCNYFIYSVGGIYVAVKERKKKALQMNTLPNNRYSTFEDDDLEYDDEDLLDDVGERYDVVDVTKSVRERAIASLVLSPFAPPL